MTTRCRFKKYYRSLAARFGKGLKINLSIKRYAIPGLSLILLLSIFVLGGGQSKAGAASPVATAVPGNPDISILPLGTSGAVEMVVIVAAGYVLPARLDTGATTSSINASEIDGFKLDGTDWVRFVVPGPAGSGAKQTISKPVKRWASIKRHGTTDQQRPVVELEIILGRHALQREFSLTDRPGFDFPLLIGRNVLAGQAIVDVSREKVLTTNLPE